MPKNVSVRQAGLYKLGHKIGIVHAINDHYVFTFVDSNGIHCEVVDFMPQLVGLTWRDVLARMKSASNAVTYDHIQADVVNVADYLVDHVTERYRAYQDSYPNWVRYSDRYDEVLINWNETPPMPVAIAVHRHHMAEPLASLNTYEDWQAVIEALGLTNVPFEVFSAVANTTKRSLMNYQDVAYLNALFTVSYNAVQQLKRGELL